MLAFYRNWNSTDQSLGPRIAGSLGLFRGRPAPHRTIDGAIFASCGHRTGPHERPLRVARSAAGRNVLVNGWIDNASELSDRLGHAADDLGGLYGAAHDHWGDDVDLHIIGDYCTLVDDPATGSVRLSRSPWRAPPLHYFRTGTDVAAASVPRVLFVCGLPRELDRRRLVDNLYLNLTEDRGWFKGSHHVDLGSRVIIEREARNTRRYYDMLAPRETRFARRADYVEAADALLREAACVTLGGARTPGILLSGGLDSPNVASRVLDCLPARQTLKSFTFRPLAGYAEPQEGWAFGDDGPFVKRFAEMHPRLEPFFSRNEGLDFDHRFDKLFEAMGIANIHLPNGYLFHSLVEEASRQGCDLLLDATFGNQTFSNNGIWAHSQFLREGKLRQLWMLIRDEPFPPAQHAAHLPRAGRRPAPARSSVVRLAQGARWRSRRQRAGRRPQNRRDRGERLA